MASFVFLTPPGRALGHEQTVAVRDGFSVLAYLFPPLWFLFHRLWLESALSALLLALSTFLAETQVFAVPGAALGIVICLFTGLEGGNLVVRQLERRDFRPAAAVEARNLAEAEEIFFSNVPLQTRTPVNSASSDPAPVFYRPVGDHRPVLGLFDLHGGR